MSTRAVLSGYWLPAVLLLAGLGLLAGHLLVFRPALDDVLPASVYEYQVEISFESFGGDLRIATFLPVTGERQTIVEETVESGALSFDDRVSDAGRVAEWSGAPPDGLVRYTAQIATRAVRFEVAPGLGFGAPLNPTLQPYLQETPAIAFRHQEIRDRWAKIRPKESADVMQTLRAIFDYTHDQIEPAPFKGYTDALTALRLGQASCNGKSRLFVAFARLNGIPARLVGGVILDTGVKRTSHQWVEAYVGDRWIPFDPLNGHFAELPARYLELYRGDESLFVHTRDINFDYAFKIRPLLSVSAASTGNDDPEARDLWTAVKRFIGANQLISEIFLLFPLAALVVTFCRNVTGLRTFGVFLPMLVGAGCRYTGLLPGLLGFIVILAIGALAHHYFRGMRMLVVPRISAVITLLTLLILVVGTAVAEGAGHRVALLSLFPVIILSFAAERLQQMAENSRIGELAVVLVSTVLVTLLCYWVFSSALLRGLFFHMPELLVLVLALQLAVGRWTGIRASEYRRFLRLFRKTGAGTSGVLGLNERNINLIGRLNTTYWMSIADDKVATKRHLDDAGVRTPRTLLTVESAFELDHRREALVTATGFALKPGAGSQGNGVVLVSRATAVEFQLVSGGTWTYAMLRAHVHDITRGLFSGAEDADVALFEELIHCDEFSRRIAPMGVPDIRVLLLQGKPAAAMLRVPTRHSGGKSNLHQGAAGFSIDMDSGVVGRGVHRGKLVDLHPDTAERLPGLQVPHWPEVLAIATRTHVAVPLGYSGIDICLDQRHGPVVIEVNARPGIEIQNVIQKGLIPELERIFAGTGP